MRNKSTLLTIFDFLYVVSVIQIVSLPYSLYASVLKELEEMKISPGEK